MTWKASKTKIAKPWVIISIIVYGICFFDLIIIGMTWLGSFLYGHMPSIEICANLKKASRSGFGLSIILANLILLVTFGLLSDFFLLVFVKKRNKDPNNSNQLIPWKVNAVKENVGVPVKTTILTLVSIIFMALTITPALIDTIVTKRPTLWLFLTIFNAWIGCQLPLLLIFTINHQKKNVVQNQPPKSLHFHDSISEENETVLNNGINSVPRSTDSNKVEDINILPGGINSVPSSTDLNKVEDSTIFPGGMNSVPSSTDSNKVEDFKILPGGINSVPSSTDSNKVEDINILPSGINSVSSSTDSKKVEDFNILPGGINSVPSSTDSNKVEDINILPENRKDSSIHVQHEQGQQMEETTILPGAIPQRSLLNYTDKKSK